MKKSMHDGLRILAEGNKLIHNGRELIDAGLKMIEKGANMIALNGYEEKRLKKEDKKKSP